MMAFFRYWGLEEFVSVGEDEEMLNEMEVLHVLKLWNWSVCITEGYRVIGTDRNALEVFCGLILEDVSVKRAVLERFLDPHIDEIRAAGFYNFK
jgi:hypothetical protein